jgi:glycerophosphoryl diester phosphodiesterase
MPAPADLRDTWLTHTPIAHRGLHDVAAGRPENSLAAFEHACRSGFPIELDVRLTRDRRVAVFHDRTLARLTGGAGRVEDTGAAELTAMRLLGTSERVPLLAGVLDLVAGRVPLLIELKSAGLSPALERAVLAELHGYDGDVAIQSFRRASLWHLDRYEVTHAVGHLSRGHMLPTVGRAAFYGCRVEGLPSRAVQRRRDAGCVVLAWTVRSRVQAAGALRHVDNVIFEGFVPDLPLRAGDAAHVSSPAPAPDADR